MNQAIGVGRRARLTPDQQALLEKRIRGEIPSKSSTVKIPRRADQSIAPLSLMQEGQWLLQHLQPDNTVFNTFRALRVARPLDHAILERVLTEVVRRHDVLRTNFHTIDGVPMQVIRPPEPVTVGMLDLSGLPAAEREAEFVRWSRKRTVEPFDLAQGELFRADLVRMAPRTTSYCSISTTLSVTAGRSACWCARPWRSTARLPKTAVATATAGRAVRRLRRVAALDAAGRSRRQANGVLARTTLLERRPRPTCRSIIRGRLIAVSAASVAA